MRFLHLTDIDGKHHVINPLHIVSVDETDAGCTLHMRGHGVPPIHLNETVEVMGDALDCLDTEEAPPSRGL